MPCLLERSDPNFYPLFTNIGSSRDSVLFGIDRVAVSQKLPKNSLFGKKWHRPERNGVRRTCRTDTVRPVNRERDGRFQSVGGALPGKDLKLLPNG
ncbi:MAG TPA: hypothetical protein DD473_23545 [Planctomycetaceae bacterium]|nr:hypothetical protein [Planctomycetaceae bacterium]